MTIVQESALPTLVYVPTPTVRRRKVVLSLTALLAGSALAAVGTGSPAAWAVVAAALLSGVAYVALLRRSRRLQMERGFRALMGPRAEFLGTLTDLAVRPEAGYEVETVVALDAVPAWRQCLALARFVVSYAAGWALAPVVFALTVAVGRTPRDTTGQRWLANLQATQLQLREQSMRTLVVSAAATASVTGVGAATVLSSPGLAAAASAPASSASLAFTGAVHATSASTTYTVQPGDTLSSVAARFGTTYSLLAATNHLANPNLIYPGQVLVIHSPGSGSGSSSSAGTYTVVAGDTLSSIAARFATTYQNLAQINGIANPNVIEVGQVLKLAGPAAPVTTRPATTAPARSSGAATTVVSTTVHASSRAQVAVQTALAQVGKPYQWAGAGPSSFDCSGLVMYAWDAAGVQLAHYTVSQYQETTRISESQLQPGDLVFYDTGSGAQPGHVTMYVGNGKVVTADSPGTVIRVEVLDWDGNPIGFGRVG